MFLTVLVNQHGKTATRFVGESGFAYQNIIEFE
jgi:hypothetical protein